MTLSLGLLTIHDACSLIKQYFRELPDPMVPVKRYVAFLQVFCRSVMQMDPDLFLKAVKIKDHEEKLLRVKSLVHSLPHVNYNVLKVQQLSLWHYFLMLLQMLCAHLHKVASYHEKNRMTIEKLALIFAPTLMSESTVWSIFTVTLRC